jgi:hypothetical protein
MRRFLGALATSAGLFTAGAALAAPTVEINHAVARVIVSPEPRADIKVDVVRTNPHMPIRVWTFFGRTYVDGGVAAIRVRDCRGPVTAPSVTLLGVGRIDADALPQIVIHTPMEVRVHAGGALFGQIGRSASLDLTNAGCGAWQVGNVRGALKVSVAGSGDVHTGQAGSAELSAAGSGAIVTREIDGPVVAMNVGAGDIEVASVRGAFKARIAGAGHVRVSGGHASAMQASIAGSGDIALIGVADSLHASVVGSGDVRVTRVTGAINKAVVGSGEVRIGS